MARTVLPLAGAVIGGMFGQPQLGFIVGSLIGNLVDPQRIKGPKLGDMGVQTAQEGTPRPIVYGTAAVVGNIIDRGTVQIVTTEESQGKGGGPVVETQRAYLTFAIRICEGPISGVTRIWEDEKLLYDPANNAEDSANFAALFRLYLGTEDQMPDPDLEVIHGAGNTPAYRGTAYIVFPNKDITDKQRIPSYRFEVVCRLVDPIAVALLFKLTSWYSFDDNLLDSYGINNLTSNVVVSGYNPGIKNSELNDGSIAFSGIENYAISPEDGAITIGAWCEIVADSTKVYGFGLTGNPGAASNETLFIAISSGHIFVYGFSALSPLTSYYAGMPTTLPPGHYFVVATLADAACSLYIDSALVSSNPVVDIYNSTITTFQVGQSYNNGITVCDVDECFFSTGYKLSQEEIDWLYNDGIGRSYSDMVALAG